MNGERPGFSGGTGRPVRRISPAIVAPAVALVIGATGVLGWTMWPRSSADGSANAARPAAPARSTSGRAAEPCGSPASQSSGPPAQCKPGSSDNSTAFAGTSDNTSSATVEYETVDQDYGYFEGRFTFVNRSGAPLTAWSLSFRYPGVNVRNVWEGELQQGGENAIIISKPAAKPADPGDEVSVDFGASGTPGTPVNCLLNGKPCTFT